MTRPHLKTAFASMLAVFALMQCGRVHADPAFGRVWQGDWSAQDRAVLASLRLSALPALPDDPSNAWQRSLAAARLGGQLFFDARFSGDGTVACSSCHDPERQFQDGRSVAVGVGVGRRRTMPLTTAAYYPWLFWDGRKDSLWSQALGPLEDPAEHGGNRVRYARLMRDHYRQAYSDLFGTMPELAALPADAGPLGSAAEQVSWENMTVAARDEVSRVFANMGKAIAAFESGLTPKPSRVDRYVEAVLRGQRTGAGELRRQEVRGLRVFIGTGDCISCHNGPLLSDQQFHNTGVPQRTDSGPDPGRAAALAKVLADEFNCLGRYSDAQTTQCEELRFLSANDATLEGAFRTPGLRGVASRAPYMHAGQYQTLEQVVRHYVEAPRAATGHSELSPSRGPDRDPRNAAARRPIRLSTTEQEDLVAFLRAL